MPAPHKNHITLRPEVAHRRPTGADARNRMMAGSDARTWEEQRAELVEDSRVEMNMARLARRYHISKDEARAIVREADAAEFQRIVESSDAERGRHYRIIDLVVAKALRGADESRIVRDRDGRPIVNPDTGKPYTQPVSPKHLAVVLDGLSDQRTIGGFNAPLKVEATGLGEHAIVSREETKALIADPVARDLMMRLEERGRELRGEGDHAAHP